MKASRRSSGRALTVCWFWASALESSARAGLMPFASPYWILLAVVPFLASQMAGRAAGHVWSGVCLAGLVVRS